MEVFSQLDRLSSLARSTSNVVRRNTTAKNNATKARVSVAVGVYDTLSGTCLLGITASTYAANAVEAALSAALEIRAQKMVERSWVVRALCDDLLVAVEPAAWDDDTQTAFVLAVRVPREVWEDVSRFAYRGTSEEGEDEGVWQFSDPAKVSTILRANAEKTATEQDRDAAARLLARRAAERKHAAAAKASRIERDARCVEIDSAFASAETPSGSFSPIGELVEDPRYRPNAGGGGHWWIVGQGDEIWSVTGNGGDGDDWRRNNIITGGAGAVGRRIVFDASLASLIHSVA